MIDWKKEFPEQIIDGIAVTMPKKEDFIRFLSLAEVRNCRSCGKDKKVLPEYMTGYILSWDDLIRENGNRYLNDEKYFDICVRCLQEELRLGLKIKWIERREAKGEPIPQWLKEF